MKQEIAGPLYDQKIAKKYDQFYQTSETGLFLREFLPKHIQEGTILDIGCGTGWLLDYQRDIIKPENYVGVDISFPMAKMLKGKHPEYNVVNGDITSITGKFNTGLGIFGPLSYMGYEEIKHINSIIDNKILLMGYNENAFSKILKQYKRPFVKGEIYPTMLKYEILKTKFTDLNFYELSDYVVFTNFDNADEIKIFNDAKKAASQLSTHVTQNYQ